ncbi:MAG: hypothetical protein J5612_06050, partial [Paludibacteraceae bacterium]|nr:hypothetical protein [Paludibacteraceae bacterium]
DGAAELVVLPAFEEPLANLTIQLYQTSLYYTSSSYGQLQIGYVTNAADASTFVAVTTLDRQASDYAQASVDLKDVPAAATNIALRMTAASSNGSIYVDDIKVNLTSAIDDPDPLNPDDVIEQNVWLMEAAPLNLPETDPDYREGKYAWVVVFATGEENGIGRPSPWFVFYTDKETAISGEYSKTLDNMAFGEQITFMDINGTASGLSTALDAELKLTFECYHGGYLAQGYRYGIYSGSYSMSCKNGKTYVAQFTDLLCNSQSYESLIGEAAQDHIAMWDEDPDPLSAVESVQMSEISCQKVFRNGQLILIRDGKKYNVVGSVLE